MTALRARALPIGVVCGFALVVPLVAPAGLAAIGLAILGGAVLIWRTTRRRPSIRR